MKSNFFQQLVNLQKKAYCPYSKFHVAAILETNVGLFYGVNVENCSYGLTNCAERTALFTAVVNGAETVETVHLITDCPKGSINMCGACRQVLSEFIVENGKVFVYDHSGNAKEYNFDVIFPRIPLANILID